MEKVNHPDHYGGDTPYEVIKVLEAWFSPDEFIGFLKGNAIKYMARHREKGGAEDLQKAAWYTKRLAECHSRWPWCQIGSPMPICARSATA